MMKNILVTGGNGYIGARLSLYLANKGYKVTPLCFPEMPQDELWRNKMAAVLCGDVRDDNFLKEVSANAYDAIVHLVSLDHHQSAGAPSFVSSVNITPTWNLLDIFSKAGLEKFLYFSTVQVYGKTADEKITEEHSLETTNAYALTHLIGEQFCDYYNRNTKTKCHVIRLSNSYGTPIFPENNCWWLVINDLCRMAFTKQKIVLQSDGSPQRDFIHGWDVAQAVGIILEKNSKQVIYNVCSGITLTIMEIAFQIKRLYQSRFGKPIDIFIPTGKVDMPVLTASSKYTIDNSALKTLGYEALWDLDKGINDLFNFFVSVNNHD